MTTTNQTDSSATNGEALSTMLWRDLKNDEDRAKWLLLGRGYETGVIAHAIQNDVAMAYHRLAKSAPQAATPSPGGLDERALSAIVERARIATDEHCEGLPHEPSKEYSDAYFYRLLTQQAAPEAPARITFAHEVDGPWRLELNGVTLSQHATRDGLNQAIKDLRAALAQQGAAQPPSTEPGK